MTSAARKAANKINARRSTGPRSQAGKARSAQNSLRHGLSLPIALDPILSAKAESWAQTIAGEGANAARLDAARQIAEAQIDLLRVRVARSKALSMRIDDPGYEPKVALRHRVSLINQLLPWALEAELRHQSAELPHRATDLRVGIGQGTVGHHIANLITSRDNGPSVMDVFAERWLHPQKLSKIERTTAAMRELAGTLWRLDRYERRALSRRKFAVRRFDLLSGSSRKD